MSSFLIATLPIRGHVTAALVVAEKLIERGHQVGWYTGSRYRAKIEAQGIQFFGYQAAYDFDDLDMEAYFPGRSGLRGVESIRHDYRHVFIEAGPKHMADLQQILGSFAADVILADFCFVGANWLHEKGGPVWATLGHTPLTLNSRDTAPFGLKQAPDSSPDGQARNRELYQMRREVVFRDVIEYNDQLRRSLGLPAVAADPGEMALSPYLFLQGSIPEFEYPRSDQPAQVHFVGPLLPPAPLSQDFKPPHWWPELMQGRPVVHITQGTIDTDLRELLLPAIEALADEEVLVVATTGGGKSVQSLGLTDLPANLRLEPYLPHAALLPYVDVMVTNGGYNGVLMALANAVPMVVHGFVNDKPEVGCRVEWAGVGLNLKNARPDRIRAAVRQILTQPGYRQKARQLQTISAQYDGATHSARLLEELALTQQPVLNPALQPAL